MYYPGKPKFYYIKVECKGVFITRTYLHDAMRSLCELKILIFGFAGHGLYRVIRSIFNFSMEASPTFCALLTFMHTTFQKEHF